MLIRFRREFRLRGYPPQNQRPGGELAELFPNIPEAETASIREDLDHHCHYLGRALRHFILSLIGLKRILFTNTFQKL